MCADLFDQHNEAEPPVRTVSARQYHCPTCRKPMRRINGRKGPFWGCSGFPECSTSLFDRDGRPSEEPDERYRCPVCTRSLFRASNERGDYWYCTGFSRGCKVTLADEQGVPAPAYRCQLCGQLLKKRSGKNGEFWGCSQYPSCRQTWPDKEGRPDFASREKVSRK